MLRAATSEVQLRLNFRRIRWFAGPPLVLWAEPTADETLAKLHASISAAIDPVHCRPHYRPGFWMPHCTLGMRVVDRQRNGAIAYATEAS